MCGIAGFFNPDESFRGGREVLEAMTNALYHRGPEEDGYFYGGHIGLGHRRLSIIDVSGGRQPIYNEDDTVCVVLNGEIFNYVELMEDLKKRGHRFRTRSDTETIVHAYEEYGVKCLDHFNGQWAFALWDRSRKRLFIARDRIGIRPLFYAARPDGTVLFASEMKSLFKFPGCAPRIDPAGLDQIFSLWVNVPPRTVFEDIRELAAGHYMLVDRGGLSIERYWRHSFPAEGDYEPHPFDVYVERFRELLHDAVTIRLRADVTVAAYLSGGIDSSVTSALVKKYHNRDLITFSVAFKDKDFDETPYQMEMVKHLGTDHRMIEADYDSIGEGFADVVWYAEKPMIRTAPAPLYILSGLVRHNRIKVVLTGEGADEMLGGYDIFKEDRIRRFWARHPDSRMRPALFRRIYPDIKRSATAGAFWQSFFKRSLTDTDNPYYSHLIRWANTGQVKSLFARDFRDSFDEERNVSGPLAGAIDPAITSWHPLCRAQYLESALFLSGYLLSSQGDRMLMGHAVEGRFPFLDHRVIEFCSTVPPEYKMFILDEKYLLKKAFNHLVPDSIVQRAKKPYRAPINQCFHASRANKGTELLRPEWIRKYGYFDGPSVARLIKKMNDGKVPLSERENMAVVGVVSTQLLHHHFIDPETRRI
jgi:asparagine synthase (glutamine-hydrolysing)